LYLLSLLLCLPPFVFLSLSFPLFFLFFSSSVYRLRTCWVTVAV
jgi:hypothetical protein